MHKSRRGRGDSAFTRRKPRCSTPKAATGSGWQQDYRTYGRWWTARISHFTTGLGGESPLPRTQRILTDILARASAINLARLAPWALHHGEAGWALA